MTIEVRVPSLGESVTEATIATWFKKPGDTVAVDEILCELETDKVSLDVPSPVAGILAEILASEGETVNAAGLLATITEGATAPAKGAPAAVTREFDASSSIRLHGATEGALGPTTCAPLPVSGTSVRGGCHPETP